MNNTAQTTKTLNDLIDWAMAEGMAVTVLPEMHILEMPGETINVDREWVVSYENLHDLYEPIQEIFPTIDAFFAWVELNR